jgi:peroxiredoxin
MIRHLKLLLLLLLVGNTYAQNSNRTITGIISSSDESTPLEGVAVTVKGTNYVSGSQADGTYYISVSNKDSVLIFSHPSFATREVKLSASNEYNISLQKQAAPEEAHNRFSPIGKWRGVVAASTTEIPFNFEIRVNTKGDTALYFLNAAEQFEGGRIQQTADSLFVALDQFDNELAFKIVNNSLEGVLRRQDKKGNPVLIKAETGKDYRFATSGTAPAGNISGTYDVAFTSDNGKEEKAVGVFKQEGNRLQGTFLRITGDARYLEGIVEGNEFYLSSFIGSGISYYKGSFNKEGQLTGTIGARGGQHFTGIPNATAALPDPYSLTLLKEGYTSFDFSFPDINGKKISLSDPKFNNKVVIVAISGTWCPNCIDEAAFLAPWYKANKKRGVEVITLHYERQTDSAFVRKALTRFRNRFGIEYDQVIAGPADKQFVASSLPALNTFLSFPTTIIIDKKGKVAQIHTGYSGPATGKYYDDFVKEFNQEIDLLVKQR